MTGNRNCLFFCTCEKYAWPAAHAARKFLENASKPTFDVIIYCSGDPGQGFDDWVHKDIQLKPLDMSGLTIKIPFGNRLNINTYGRILKFAELATQYDRILYYDADISVQSGDLSQLFGIEMNARPVAAVRDLLGWGNITTKFRSYTANLGIADPRRYLNAGMMLVDRPNYTANKVTDLALEAISTKPHLLRSHDQSALNSALSGNWTELDPT